jgi:hypothetical protein
VAEGTFQELTGDEREQALRIIYPETIPDLGGQTVVFRITLTSKSGRYERPE